MCRFQRGLSVILVHRSFIFQDDLIIVAFVLVGIDVTIWEQRQKTRKSRPSPCTKAEMVLTELQA